MPPVSIAVIGAGLIGKRHIERIGTQPGATLHAIVDPSAEARSMAEALGAPWFADFDAMLRHGRPDGLVIASPTGLHVEQGLAAIGAGLPTLVEKPLADRHEDGLLLVEAAERAGVPILVGHHRRHTATARRAADLIASGRLGTIISVHCFFWIMKPKDYYETGWRRGTSGGPILTNLIHDIDLLRSFCGEIDEVSAFRSNAVRGFEAEESVAVALRFASGALGTLNVSDTIVAPWNWEQTSAENPVFPRTSESCYMIGGTSGSLSVPRLETWTADGEPGWTTPFETRRIHAATDDAIGQQMRHFCDVVRGSAAPLVSGRDGLATLGVVGAIKQAAASGLPVRLDAPHVATRQP